MIDLLAVTGNPILHSRSPLLFNAAFEANNEDAFYTRLLCQSGEEAVSLFRKLGLKGMNVTAPFKVDVVPFLDELTQEAIDLGCVNTIYTRNGKVIGTNTDFVGVSRSIEVAGHSISGMTFLLLGAGGASAGAAYALKKMGAKVIVVNRTFEKAVDLANRFQLEAKPIEALESLMAEVDGLVSSVLPSANLIKKEWLRKELIVFDANYANSQLNEMAENVGCQMVYGQDWLLYQAVAGYEYFFESPAPEAAMKLGLTKDHFKNKPKGKVLVLRNESNNEIKEINFDNSFLSLFFANSFQLKKEQFDLVIQENEKPLNEIKNILNAETDKAFGH